MAPKKKKNGDEVFTFWDKQCLNYGQDWQLGFLHGLKNAKVILLLISEKVLYYYCYVLVFLIFN